MYIYIRIYMYIYIYICIWIYLSISKISLSPYIVTYIYISTELSKYSPLNKTLYGEALPPHFIEGYGNIDPLFYQERAHGER